jgi:hypothetical protein
MSRMSSAEELTAALPTAAREIEEFVHSAGWDQPAQVFALVDTDKLLTAEPNLSDQLDPNAPLTPIAQDSLPSEDLSEALTRIEWPEQVEGCALVQEIVILPPEAESDLPEDQDEAAQAAAEHPDRQEARLVAAVLRGGEDICVMRVRDNDEELYADRSLAPNLLTALHGTFQA